MIKYLEKKIDEELKGKKVLVDFFATWCGPCKMFSETLKEVEKEIDIDIIKVDVDKFPDEASRYNVFSVPTIYLFDDLKIMKTHTGYLNKEELIEFVK